MKGIVLLVLMAGMGMAQEMRQRVGKHEVELRLPGDGLAAQEEVEIEMRVTDWTRVDAVMGAAAVVRAKVEVRIDMPEMPGMPAHEEVAHAEGMPGDYGVHPVFAHGGAYRMKVQVKTAQGESFGVEFGLAVADARPAGMRKGPRFRMDVETRPRRVKAGEKVELRIVVRERDKPKEAFRAVRMVHEALMHLIVVRRDLGVFLHEHPQLQKDGSFRVELRLPAGGEYRLFADIAPERMGSQVLRGSVEVSGEGGAGFDLRGEMGKGERKVVVEGEEVELGSVVVAAKKSVVMEAKVPRGLEPYLGAAGHFLLVSEGGERFVHAHPEEDGEEGRLRFLVRFPEAGIYRGWLQVKKQGRVLTAPFVVRAEGT